MLKELFKRQQESINHFFNHIDMEQVKPFLDVIAKCRGLVIWSGVGKSGIVAEKIALTMSSTGTRSLYLPPMNFLHGDIGLVQEGDIVVFISKSGETQELIDLIPFVKRKKGKILALVSSENSKLAKEADLSVFLPLDRELCPFDLSPTTSTSIQMIFGDVISVALMEKKEFPIEEYAKNHPSGSIGRKMTLTVDDLMLKDQHLPVCFKEQKLREVLVDLSEKKCGCLLVTDQEKKLLGIFTDGDLRRAIQERGENVLEQSVESLMSHAAKTLPRDLLATEALKLMQSEKTKWVSVMPVIEKEEVVGVLRMHDIVHSGLSE